MCNSFRLFEHMIYQPLLCLFWKAIETVPSTIEGMAEWVSVSSKFPFPQWVFSIAVAWYEFITFSFLFIYEISLLLQISIAFLGFISLSLYSKNTKLWLFIEMKWNIFSNKLKKNRYLLPSEVLCNLLHFIMVFTLGKFVARGINFWAKWIGSNSRQSSRLDWYQSINTCRLICLLSSRVSAYV